MITENFIELLFNTIRRKLSGIAKGISKGLKFSEKLFSEFKKDKCFIRASSLAYSSLMALIPLTALSFSLFTAFDTFSGIKDNIQKSLVALLIPTQHDTLYGYIDQFLENSKTMGVIGLLLFALTSIMLLNRISESFNSI